MNLLERFLSLILMYFTYNLLNTDLIKGILQTQNYSIFKAYNFELELSYNQWADNSGKKRKSKLQHTSTEAASSYTSLCKFSTAGPEEEVMATDHQV